MVISFGLFDFEKLLIAYSIFNNIAKASASAHIGGGWNNHPCGGCGTGNQCGCGASAWASAIAKAVAGLPQSE